MTHSALLSWKAESMPESCPGIPLIILEIVAMASANRTDLAWSFFVKVGAGGAAAGSRSEPAEAVLGCIMSVSEPLMVGLKA